VKARLSVLGLRSGMARGIKTVLGIPWLNRAVSRIIATSGLLEEYRNHLLSTHHDPVRRSLLDRLLYPGVLRYWLAEKYYPERDPMVRERMKSILIEPGSRSWASTYDRQPFNLGCPLTAELTLGEAVPLYLRLRTRIEEYTGKLDRQEKEGSKKGAARKDPLIIQIGVGSGRELAWFARQFPGITCIGTDAFFGAVSYAGSRYRLPNLEFRLLPLERASELLEDQREGRLFLYTSGLFHFVQPESVDGFLAYVSTFPELELFVSEPVSLPRLEEEAFPENSMPRAKPLSWTHNYPRLVRRNHLTIHELILTNHPYDDRPGEFGSVNCFIHATPAGACESIDE